MNEIVRRVDPEKRTIGEILKNEVCIDGVHCGISEGQIENTALLRVKPFSWLIRQCFTPKGIYINLSPITYLVASLNMN